MSPSADRRECRELVFSEFCLFYPVLFVWLSNKRESTILFQLVFFIRCQVPFIYDALVCFYMWVRNSVDQQCKRFVRELLQDHRVNYSQIKGHRPFRTEICHVDCTLEPAGGIFF